MATKMEGLHQEQTLFFVTNILLERKKGLGVLKQFRGRLNSFSESVYQNEISMQVLWNEIPTSICWNEIPMTTYRNCILSIILVKNLQFQEKCWLEKSLNNDQILSYNLMNHDSHFASHILYPYVYLLRHDPNTDKAPGHVISARTFLAVVCTICPSQ